MPQGTQQRVVAPERHTKDFRRIVVLLISLVTVPTGLLLAVGVLMLVFYRSNLNLVFGILVVTLVACLGAGSGLAFYFLRRQANLSQLQTDFVSKVSHELRTPLTSIRMFTETLQQGRIPPEQRTECIDALALETSRLTERIERLLDWGRMEAGKRTYTLQPDTPRTIVEAAHQAFDTVTMGRNVPIEVEVEEGLPELLADRDAMVDALVNLLSNAFKYSGDDRRIRLQVEAEGRFVVFSVVDNGIGIAPSEQRHVWKKFYRADDRLSRLREGTGLGLAIVKHVAQAHGGRVRVESEPRRGSTFSLLLPRPKVADMPAGPPVEASA